MCILPLAFSFLFLKLFIFAPLHLFSGVEVAMKGVAPVDQSAEEGPKGTSIIPTSSPSCPPDISQSPPPYSSSIVPLHSSPPTISPITISPDIPIRVEYLPDSVTVPSPIFLFQGYSSSLSTLSSTSLSTSQTFSTITNPTTISLPDQDVSHLASLPRPIPILGSFSISSQTLSDPYPSDSSSLDILPPLSSSIICDQVLSSYSFAPSIVIPPSVLTSSPFHSTSFSRKSRGARLVKGKSSRGQSPRDRPPRGRRGNPRVLPTPSPHFSSSSCNLSFPRSLSISSHGYFSKEGVLDLSTKPRVHNYFPHTPSVNPFFTNYSSSPKIFSPIVSFNEPSEYVFNMFSFTYSCDFFPGQDNRLISAIKW